MTQATRVITPLARLSYPSLFTPRAMEEGQTPKFSCELLFDEGDDLSELEAAIEAAKVAKWGDKIPRVLKHPLREGSCREQEQYEGTIFMSARSTSRPGIVVGPNKEECIDPEELYPGCHVRCSVTAFGYDKAGNRGVAFFLNHVWKVSDGERLGGGGGDPAEAFAGCDAESHG